MSKKFKILVDSTIDLLPEHIKLIDPEIIPLIVNLGEESFQDYIELDGLSLYDKMEELGKNPKTSAVNPDAFTKAFEKIKQEGYTEVLYVGIGNAFSMTLAAAKVATEEFKGLKIRLVDSHTLSTGSGLLALRAHDLRSEGKSLDEVADYLETLGHKVRAQFIVDNLKMLAAGGRVTGIKYFLGSILKAHHYLQVNEDKLEVQATPKGKIEKALDLMIETARKEIEAGLESPRIAITNSFGGDSVKYVVDELSKFVNPKDIFVPNAGSVISSHCGKGTVAIIYIRK